MALPGIFSVWRRKAEYVCQDIRASLHQNAPYLRSARGARIVVYHGVCREDHLRFNNIFVTLKTFEAHLKLYKKHFNVVSLEDYYQGRFSHDRFNICIHFDDGYANQLHYVLPLLEQYQLPASFFITAIREAGYDILWNDFLGMLNRFGPEELDFIGQHFRKQQGLFPSYISTSTQKTLRETLMPEGFGPKAALIREFDAFVPRHAHEEYWLQMTPAQIRTLSASEYVTIGAHGYYHNDLSKLPLADAEKEIRDSKRFLEDLIGKEVQALAFPYGTYTADLVDIAKKANFSQVLPLGIRHPDPTLRERVIINPYISVTNQLLNIIKNRYDFWR